MALSTFQKSVLTHALTTSAVREDVVVCLDVRAAVIGVDALLAIVCTHNEVVVDVLVRRHDRWRTVAQRCDVRHSIPRVVRPVILAFPHHVEDEVG